MLRRLLDPPSRWVLGQLLSWRSLAVLPLVWTYRLTDQQSVIDADCERWADLLWMGPDQRFRLLGRFLFAFPEFRSVYYHRLSFGNPAGALAARLCQLVWKGVPGIDLSGTPIGPGLFISHGQATILSAERIGANLQVHQGVTVGWDYRGDRRPIIGDDVFIGAGAKVLGAITIGDGARIGANAVVLCDVPAGATAAGVPAVIRCDPASISGLPS
ncbi:MAG TPA: DapH/DapD/GlmU-related protein [Acidimicrobiales bacterium]|nr:DapH/DapD/GlmU-related protein [Acidimicrobiales bacterium]